MPKEHKNGKICNDSDSRFGEEHKMDNDTYSLYDALKKIVVMKYTHGSLNQLTENNILWRVTISYISKRMGQIGGTSDQKQEYQKAKRDRKEN